MKVIRIVFLLGVFFFSTLTAHVHAAETWKITSLDWQPYSGSEMTNYGNSIQILKELLAQKGIKLLVEFYPWKRSQFKATQKDYVGYFPAWPEEVVDGFFASPPVDWSELGVIKRTGTDISFDSIDELFKKYRVGIVKNYVYPQIIEDAMKKYPEHVAGAPQEVSLLLFLSKGRSEVVITDPNVILFLAAKNGVDNVEPMENFKMEKELVIAFRDGDDNKARFELLKELLAEELP